MWNLYLTPLCGNFIWNLRAFVWNFFVEPFSGTFMWSSSEPGARSGWVEAFLAVGENNSSASKKSVFPLPTQLHRHQSLFLLQRTQVPPYLDEETSNRPRMFGRFHAYKAVLIRVHHLEPETLAATGSCHHLEHRPSSNALVGCISLLFSLSVWNNEQEVFMKVCGTVVWVHV